MHSCYVPHTREKTVRNTPGNDPRTDKPAFQVRHKAVQRQSGTTDCGLFSIAIAQALCAGVDPHLQALDQQKSLFTQSNMY